MIRVHINAAARYSVPHDLLERALREAFRREGVSSAEVSVSFVTDAEIAGLHGRYLGRDEPTDVLSFALHGDGEDPLGDIYVGHPQALRQAADAGVAPEEELTRLAVHGALHVLGYDHPDGPERFASEMFHKQEEALRRALQQAVCG